jgi:multidrug efflux system outer membrane protein
VRLLLLAAAALGGCSLAPKYVRPEAPVPPSWPLGDAYLRQSEATLPSLGYRDVFRDTRLQALIDQALANNRDLRIAAANIASARAQYRIQRADLFPQLDAGGGYSYGRRSSTGSTGSSGVGGGTSGGSTNSAYSVDLGATAFEIDLFGRVRSLTGAALDRYFATEAAARTVRLTLVGDIAEAWFAYAADLSLLKIAEDTAASAERSVRLTRLRLEGGIAPRTDLRQAEQILATAQADLAEQRTALAQDVNALQLLVGAPVAADLLPGTIETVAGTVATLRAGIDSSILLRRPDVVEAEYALRAANAEIGAARAALFPRISLTGVVGFASSALSSLFSGGAFTYSVAPSISAPIFRAGAGRAGVAFSQAQRDVALASYERAIQAAFRETADALAREGTIAAQLAANERFGAAALDTFQLTEARYRGGIDPFLASLDAQRSLYSAQRVLVGTRLVAAQNRVALYRALGGDATLDVTPAGPVPVTPGGAPRPQ